MTKIAFLGLGAMGSRMAARLLDAGHDLTIWNRTPERAAPLVGRGAIGAASPREAAVGAEVVIAMVRDDEASKHLWSDPESGAAQAIDRGALAIECSTLTVDWMSSLGKEMARRQIAFVDAPLAGSRPQAEAGQLIFFAGGEAPAIERARPVLLAMGGAVHHAGQAVGAGAAVKLLVNALFGTQVAALAELLAMGERLGVPAQTSAAILGETPILSPAAKNAAAAIVAGAFAPQFPIDLVEKDFGYVEAAAQSAGTKVPVSSAVRAVFQTAKNRGLGESNITAVVQVYRR